MSATADNTWTLVPTQGETIRANGIAQRAHLELTGPPIAEAQAEADRLLEVCFWASAHRQFRESAEFRHYSALRDQHASARAGLADLVGKLNDSEREAVAGIGGAVSGTDLALTLARCERERATLASQRTDLESGLARLKQHLDHARQEADHKLARIVNHLTGLQAQSLRLLIEAANAEIVALAAPAISRVAQAEAALRRISHSDGIVSLARNRGWIEEPAEVAEATEPAVKPPERN